MFMANKEITSHEEKNQAIPHFTGKNLAHSRHETRKYPLLSLFQL